MKNIRSLFLATIILILSIVPANAAEPARQSYNEIMNQYVAKGFLPKQINPKTEITIGDFLSLAVKTNSYRHGEDPLVAAALNNWIDAEEFKNIKPKQKMKLGELTRISQKIIGSDAVLSSGDSGNKNATYDDAVSILQRIRERTSSQNANTKSESLKVEDFFTKPVGLNYQLSDDGQYLAYRAPYENRLNIFVMKMDGSEPIQITNSTDRDISSFLWKDDYIIYEKDNGGDENYHINVASIDGEIQMDLTPYENVLALIIDPLPKTKNEMLIAMNQNNPQVFDVYRINIITGDLTLVAENPGNVSDWLTDNTGAVRLATISDGVKTTVLHRATEKDEFIPIYQANKGDTFTPVAFTKDNKNLYVISNTNRNTTALIVYQISTGKEALVYGNKNYDLYGATFNKDKTDIGAVVYFSDKLRYVFMDKEVENLYKTVYKKFGTKDLRIAPDKKYESAIVVLQSDTNPGEFYHYNIQKDIVTPLGKAFPWLDSSNMCEIKPISYESRDGLTINGYLTIPKGKEIENLPVVVNPHGGPWHRDCWGFNPEVQLLANRGYAVLQMNFRGSTGYGKDFLAAGNKQWGKKMQDDITDGVNWLIKIGVADKDKIAIYGASYGGYAVLSGVTTTPDLYAAAIDYVGVSNLFTFLKTIPPHWEPSMEMFYERIGDPVKDKALLEEASPVYHVNKIKTPLFVAQGANDPRVNQAESDQIVKALQARGVDVAYMLKENEGHGFALQENTIEFYKAMEEFLAKYL